MKTLDEVIDAMERCSIPHYFDCEGCPYEDDDAEVGCRSDDRDKDVLHYLKEYRKHLEEDVAKNATAELERAENAYCNDVKRAVRSERAWQAYRKERS